MTTQEDFLKVMKNGEWFTYEELGKKLNMDSKRIGIYIRKIERTKKAKFERESLSKGKNIHFISIRLVKLTYPYQSITTP